MSTITTAKDDLKILWYFFKPYKSQMIFVVALMILSSLFESLNLAGLYPIINYGLNLEAKGTSLQFIETILNLFGQKNFFVASCLLLMVLTTLAMAFKLVYNIWASKLITKIVADHQKRIFEKYLSADYDFFLENQQGRLVYSGTVAPTGVSSNVFYAIRMINSFMTTVFFTVLLFILAWQGMCLILFVSFFYLVYIRRLTKSLVNRYSHLWVEEDRKKNIILNEFITGIKTIKAFLNLNYWKEKYDHAVHQSALYSYKVMMGRAMPDSVLKFIFFMCFAFIGIFFGLKNSVNIVSVIPLLGTFAMVALRLIPYLNLIAGDAVAIARYMPDTKIVYNLLCQPIEGRKDGEKTSRDFEKEIAFHKVSFRHEGMIDPLLKDLSFNIQKGKMTAIVGPSGSGKTTIVNLLLRLYEPHEGQIFIDGTDVWDLTAESYLSKVGYVSQETFIFNGTIGENICFGRANYSKEEVIQAAKLANAHEFISGTEHGYGTKVGDAGMKLSGGQRQRLAIARAMLRAPQILILDEATSSLDNISEKIIQEAINNISQNTTVLIIAHRLSTVQHADKIIVLEGGQIAEQGSHQDLLLKEKAYFQLYKNA